MAQLVAALITVHGLLDLALLQSETFSTRRLPVVSRTGRTEYQLLLMKASDRGRNVKFR